MNSREEESSSFEDEEESQSISSGGLSDEDRELLQEAAFESRKRPFRQVENSDDELEHMFDDEEEEPVKALAARDQVVEEEEDSLSDFIEDEDEHEEEEKEASEVKQGVAKKKPVWIDRKISRAALNDLLDIFGDGTEYLSAVLKGLKLKRKSEEEKSRTGEDAPVQHSSVETQPKPNCSDPYWLIGRMGKNADGEEYERLCVAVETVTALLARGVTVPFIAAYRKDLSSSLDLNDLWTVHDLACQFDAFKRRASLFAKFLAPIQDDLKTLGLLPQASLLSSPGTSDLLDCFQEFLSDVRVSLRSKGSQLQDALKGRWCFSELAFPIDDLASSLRRSRPLGAHLSQPGEAQIGFVGKIILSHPGIYNAFRDHFEPLACLTVTPTTTGERLIDNRHELARFKFLTKKPVSRFVPLDFLLLFSGQKQGLVKVSLEFLDQQRNIDQVCELLPRYLKPYLEQLLRDRLLPRLSRFLLTKLATDGEQWMQRRLLFSLQEKISTSNNNQGKRLVCLTVALDEPILAAAHIDPNGKLVKAIEQPFENSPVDAWMTFLQKANPDLILLSGRDASMYDHFLDLHARKPVSPVIFVEDDTARLWAESEEAIEQFPKQTPLTRYAIGVIRRTKDPLQVFTSFSDAQLLSLNLHPKQGLISDAMRLAALKRGLLNCLMAIGLELKFPADLQKLRFLTDATLNSSISSRDDLLACLKHREFVNVAGFLKLPDSPEPLDRTRIHPCLYSLARRLAASVTSADDPIKAVMKSPELLEPLLLDQFAVQCQSIRGEFAEFLPDPEQEAPLELIKSLLQEMRKELKAPFKDPRDFNPPFRMSPSMILKMLTGEDEESLIKGRLLRVKLVSGMPYDAILEPSKLQVLFTEIQPGGNSNTQQGEMSAVVDHVDPERMVLHVSAMTRDLAIPAHPIYGGSFDEYYDHQRSRNVLENGTSASRRDDSLNPAVKLAATKHRLFKALSKNEAEIHLGRNFSEFVVIRPSRSLGPDHLAITLKLWEGLYQHLELQEKSARSYLLNGELYDSIDEIVGRYIEPVRGFFAEVAACPKFSPAISPLQVESWLTEQRRQQPDRIAYCFWFPKDKPGTMMLSHNSGKPMHEQVEVNPAGFLFRRKTFERLALLVNWFKANFDKFPPPTKPTARR